ncbi:hypothetical protein, partial [Sinorhizobium medicae]|uniref:hypothetical protein n=1 Tax=Sinorhizobium medicae TaxID=110321 RepID=UPI001F3CFAD6
GRTPFGLRPLCVPPLLPSLILIDASSHLGCRAAWLVGPLGSTKPRLLVEGIFPNLEQAASLDAFELV